MAEAVAQTTNVETASVQEPIEVVGGNSPVSFDEMEAVTNWRDRVGNQKEVKTAQRRDEEGDDLEEVLAEGKEAKKDAKPKAEPKEAKQEPKKAEGKANTQGEPQKALTFKVAGKDLEVSAQATVPVKVDGKTIEVPVQEVINRYSQQRHLDDLFRKHKTEKEQFDGERKKISDVISKSYEMLSQKKDLKGFVEYMSEALGVDGQKLYSDAVEKIRQAFEEESTLTPEERRLKQLEEENTFYRTKAEQARTAEAQAKQAKALEAEVEQTLTAVGMDKAAFVKAYDDLIATGVDAASINPKTVAQFYTNQRTITKIESKLADIKPELASDPATIERLATLAIQTGANDSEMEAVIEQLYANEAEKRLARKINKSVKAKAAEGPKRAGSDPMFFDDV